MNSDQHHYPLAKSGFRVDASVGHSQHTPVFICDILASETLINTLDAQTFIEIMATCRHRCEAIIRHRCGEILHSDTSLIIASTVPNADQTIANRTGELIYAGFTIIETIESISAQLQQSIATAIYILDNQTLIRPTGQDLRTVVKKALTLMPASAGSKLIVTDSIQRSTSQLFVFADFGCLSPAGLTPPVKLWQIVSERRGQTH